MELATNKLAIDKLQQLTETIPQQVSRFSDKELSYKSAPEVWSKKEILGHLVDSALHNLRRFVAAHYMEMPFAIAAYEQDALVASNHYQDLPIEHILKLWVSLNEHINAVVDRLSPEQLADEVINPDEFKFLSIEQLFEEYLAHMEQHLNKLLQ
ncbi:MAG: DinB family protein [Saprospiraceae bacterium]